MPSNSFKQARTMAAAAHDPKFAAKLDIPVKVATEFNKEDQRTGMLANALRAKKPRRS